MLDYRPDFDPRIKDLLTDVNEMDATAKGYRAAIGAATYTAHSYSVVADEVYPNKLFASRWLSTPGGIIIAGTNKKLNVFNFSLGFLNVSKAGDYTLGGQTAQVGEDAAAAFDICAFGDRLIATHKSTATQHRTALDLTTGVLFADLAGAPKAATCAVSRNFVFLGGLNSTWGSTTTVVGAADMVAWSGIGDYTDWSNNVTVTQSSYAILNDTPGPVTCVHEFRDGIVVFKPESMYVGRYVGPGSNSPVWDFERISDKIGCVGHRSCTSIEGALVWVGKDDFYRFDGTVPVSITDGIRDTIRANHDWPGSVYSPVIGHDLTAFCVIFGRYNAKNYVWYYRQNRWSTRGSNLGVFCKTNANDFRVRSQNSVSAGEPSFATTSTHKDLYTLYLTNGTPFTRAAGGARSTAGSVKTGAIGQPDKLRTLTRVNPIYASRPATVSNATLDIGASKTPGNFSALGTVTLNANYRFDNLAIAGVTNNFFQLTHNCSEDHEIVGFDVDPNMPPAGSR